MQSEISEALARLPSNDPAPRLQNNDPIAHRDNNEPDFSPLFV
jgi:hypothetical protein